jgi:RNA polymerase sigma-70 factor (ECF subfamily)
MDTSAFEEIYETHRAAVERHAARLVGQADADDIAQEVFVAAYRALREGETVAHMGAWLHRIATNRALDRLRSADQRLRSGATPEEYESRVLLSSLPVLSVEDQAARTEMSACVRGLIAGLPLGQRLPLSLSELDGLGDREIAAQMGLSLGAVKIRLHRARAALRNELRRRCQVSIDRRNDVVCVPIPPLTPPRILSPG